MKTSVVAWGLVLLVGFWASDYLLGTGFSEAYLWIAWAIIFNILNYAVGKTMKKTPKEIGTLWMMGGVFGFLVTIVVAMNVVDLPFFWLMSLWLILMGAALFTGGHKMNNPGSIMMGIIYLFAALFVPTAGYFTYGALVFGLLGLISGYFARD